MSRIFIAHILFFCLIFSSCERLFKKDRSLGHPELKATSFSSIFDIDDNHLFRGIDFDDKKEHIMKLENGKSTLINQEDFALFYEVELPKDSLKNYEYANINYFFNNNKCDVISVEYQLVDSTRIEMTEKAITTYFNLLYGDAHEDDYGYQVWTWDNDKDKDHHYDVAIKRGYQLDEPDLLVEFSKIAKK
ncbi:MAG: hypothetical protein K1X55_00325 [Chitinophagales bacterium]|nr:hypothetical protein [Chitinophagales bacterium]